MKNVEDIYELSPMQSGMLFDGLAVDNAAMYRVFSLFRLHGDLDIPRFREAWRQVARRHAAIRTSIHFEGLEKPLQIVHREVDLPIELIDLQGLPKAEQEERVQAHVREERAKAFDLRVPPLMRLALFVTGPRSYRFLWTIHHILVEGWSVSIILADVLKIYEALSRGAAAQLPPVRLYRDFILWMQQQDYAGSEAFWRRQLQGFTSPTPLPGGRGSAHLSSAVENYGGHKIGLGAEFSASLESFARERKLTLNTVMRAAWAYLLSCYSSERDVLFGTLVSGRSIPLEGVESMVGLFVNLVPVRAQVPLDVPVATWLKAIQAQQAEMSQHEFCGLTQIKRWSELRGSLPLFETLMIFENWAGDLGNWNGIVEVQDCQGGQIGQGYPITIVIEPEGGQLTLCILYDERRVDRATALRLLEHLRLIVEFIPSHPASKVGDLPALIEAERRQVLGEWSGKDAVSAPHLPVHRLIEAQAARMPDAVAVAHVDRRLTYRQLEEEANRLAHHLTALGVGPEKIVGICLERSPELIVALLAVHKAGGAYLPLDPKYPAERLAFMLNDAAVGVLVTSQELAALLPAKDRAVVLIDADRGAIAARPATAPASDVAGESAAYVIYTSGSTGTPKGVVIEQRALSHFVAVAIDAYAVQPSDRVLQFATINFDTAAEEIFPTLAQGATLVLRTEQMQYSLEEFLRRCDEWRVSVIDLPSAFWHELVDALDGQALALPPSVRLVIIGGEAALPERVAAWRARVGAHPRLLNTYGPTEATVVATVHDLSRPDDPAPASETVPIGRPLGAARVYVLDERRQPVPRGVAGELYIGGAGLARGYLNRPQLTAERFIPDPFSNAPGARLYRTGDRVRYRDDGVLEYRGRADHQIKLRGHRIELGEIEAALAQEPFVRDAVVLFRDDLAGPPGLVAYVASREESRATSEALRAGLRARLPDYMIPAAFVFLDALPLLPNGKLDRRRLPAPDARPGMEQILVEPRSDIERRVAAMWREVLGLEKVGIHDNFFDLGGHSLLLMKLHAKLKTAFERDLSFVDLFEHTTIADLARLLGREDAPANREPDAETRDTQQQAGQQRLQARRARMQPGQ